MNNNKNEQVRFENEVKIAISEKNKNNISFSAILVSKKTPKILLDIGFNNLPILLSKSHLYSALKTKNYKKHHKGLSLEKHIFKIPHYLKCPALIINDSNPKHSGDVLLVVNDYDSDFLPIVISIRGNSHRGKYVNVDTSNYIITIFPHNDIVGLITSAVNNNDIIFYNKKRIQEMCQFTGKNVSNILAPLKSNIILQHFVDNVKLISAVTKKGSHDDPEQ